MPIFSVTRATRATRASRREDGDVDDAPIPSARGGGDRRPRATDRVLEPHRPHSYLHPSLHHKTFPGAGPAASYRGRSGAFSDELQPTESFRNVSDPQYEFGTLGGDDMGKAFA